MGLRPRRRGLDLARGARDARLLVASLALSTARIIYFPDDDDGRDHEECGVSGGGGAQGEPGGAAVPIQGQRDPETGQCEYLGGSGSIPSDQSGPIQGGACEGLDPTTCSMRDDCVAIHAASCGAGGCTVVCEQPVGCDPQPCRGVCVPDEPPPTCAALVDEAACVARIDCTPYYRGEDCVCTGVDCTCTWVFDACA